MVMTFKCEDVEVGDILVCTQGDGGCCTRRGQRYEVIIPDGWGVLGFMPSCFEDNGDYMRVDRLIPAHFDLIRKSGPW